MLLPAGDAALRAQETYIPPPLDSSMIDSLRREIEGIESGESADTAAPAIVRYDSAGIARRKPSAEAMERFLSNDDFNYDREPRDPETLLQKILRWFYSIFRKLFPSTESEVTFWTWLFRAIAAAALVYVVLKLVQSDIRSLFFPGAERKGSGFTEIDEDIHEMNFDTLIDEAVSVANYRRAVRLLYLRSLKELTDRGAIEWKRNKTNHDYLLELRDSPLRVPFADATWLFEYVWYGNLPVSEPVFRNIRETFVGLSSTITRRS